MYRIDKKFAYQLIVLILLLAPVAASSLREVEETREIRKIEQEKQALAEAQALLEKKLYLMGRFNPAEHPFFVRVPAGYTTLGIPVYLRKETYEAFLKMAAAAELEGIKLKIASATRNFDYQKNIWDNKWSGKTLVDGQSLPVSTPDGNARFRKILEYSAAPGTSRHHWGTDVDFYYATPSYFDTPSGKKNYEWLQKNASAFGFCQTYDFKDSDRTVGYNEEKWHWSYLPLAKTFTEEYKTLITERDLGGFQGEEFIAGQNLINEYVLGINPECL